MAESETGVDRLYHGDSGTTVEHYRLHATAKTMRFLRRWGKCGDSYTEVLEQLCEAADTAGLEYPKTAVDIVKLKPVRR